MPALGSRAIAFAAALLGAGCAGGAQDVDGGTTTFAAPDLTGSYVGDVVEAAATDPASCPDDAEVLLSWLEGQLEVTGPPEALVFSTAGGDDVSGAVDTAFEVTWDDTVDRVEGVFDLQAVGLAYIDADLWIIELDLQVGLSSSTGDCQLTALFEAGQISE